MAVHSPNIENFMVALRDIAHFKVHPFTALHIEPLLKISALALILINPNANLIALLNMSNKYQVTWVICLIKMNKLQYPSDLMILFQFI